MTPIGMRASSGIKPTLGLVGATVNAMALIAPGAFLWITIQMQAAATAPSGASVASDMWFGIVVALGVAFLTAYSYSQLARIVPGGGLCQLHLFCGKGLSGQPGREVERAAIPGAHGEARHRLVRAPLLLGLPGSHGRHDGDIDRVHLFAVFGEGVVPGGADADRNRLRRRDRIHRLPGRDRVNADGALDQCHPVGRPGVLQRTGDLVPRCEPGTCRRVVVHRRVGHRQAALVQRRPGSVHAGDPDPGRV